ncbi:MAG: glycosyltransferase [Treponemataceae bacterium]
MRTRWPNLKVFADEWSWVHLPGRETWDIAVFFQNMPSRLLLDSVNIRNAILIPMYDTCPKEKEYWDQFLDCGIVCFSKALSDLLTPWGHTVIRVQYYPEVPQRGIDWGQGAKKAFFWPRKPDLGWSVVRRFLEGREWEKVHLHVTESDEALVEGLTREDEKRFSISRTKWFINRGEMFRVLADCQIYFAPRRTEGIGMSFLEAMALGMAVVAPDAPTMNEYIRDGENGYLYDPDDPKPISFEKAQDIGKRARQSIIEGKARWQATESDLLGFIANVGIERARARWTEESRSLQKIAMKKYRSYIVLEPLRMIKRMILKILTREKK